MDTYYDGGHSIIFNYGEDNESHSWEDWALVPASRPFVAIPSVKTRTLEIPGSNGTVDLSDIPLGMPTFNNRSGSWTFNVAHDQLNLDWQEHLSLMTSYFHGQKHKFTLEDDRSYYYEGRLYLESYSPGQSYSTVNIKYDVQPFKWMMWTTTGAWEWNPFDLIYGEIEQSDFSRIQLTANTTTTIEWTQNQIGAVPVTPTFVTESAISGTKLTVLVDNSFNGLGEQEHEVELGEHTYHQIMFACPSELDTTTIKITPTNDAYVSIDFRPGRL